MIEVAGISPTFEHSEFQLKTTNRYPSRLPTEIKAIRNLIRASAVGFDRIEFWIDDPEPIIAMRALKGRCGRVLLRREIMPFNLMWKSKIIVLQPRREAFEQIIDAIGCRYNYCITYCEITCDLITKTHKSAQQVKRRLNEFLYEPYSRQLPSGWNGTNYSKPRANEYKRKNAKVLTQYVDEDQGSKLPTQYFGHPCHHIEIRLSRSESLAAAGITTFDDVLDFCLYQYINDKLYLLLLPSSQRMAAIVRSRHGSVSTETKRKDVAAFKKKFEIDGGFSVTAAVSGNRKLKRVCERLAFDHLLKDKPLAEWA